MFRSKVRKAQTAELKAVDVHGLVEYAEHAMVPAHRKEELATLRYELLRHLVQEENDYSTGRKKESPMEENDKSTVLSPDEKNLLEFYRMHLCTPNDPHNHVAQAAELLEQDAMSVSKAIGEVKRGKQAYVFTTSNDRGTGHQFDL